MGWRLGTVNFPKLFNSLSYVPVFVNDFSAVTVEGREELSRLLTTSFEGDVLETIPRCACPENPLRGNANKGKRCGTCNHEVEDPQGGDINPLVWIRPPDGIKYFCNPIIWTQLQEHFSKGKLGEKAQTSYISWLSNKDYRPHPNHKPMIDGLINAGFKRGWNYFVENYKEIITYLHQNGYGKSAGNKLKTTIRRDNMYNYFMDNLNDTFTEMLPIPNRIAFVTETTTSGKVVDPSQVDCLDAVRAICSVSSGSDLSFLGGKKGKKKETKQDKAEFENGEAKKFSPRVIENRVFRFHELISNYYMVNYIDVVGKKPGISRHHVYGTRLEFTARGVITSIANNHDYDECHMPWSMAVGLLRIHIYNKLDKLGYTPREKSRIVARASNHHCEIVEKILNELIEESPYSTLRSGKKGIPIVLQRNPTLDRLSAQVLYVTKIKSDNIEDNTIGLSVLVLKGPNAD